MRISTWLGAAVAAWALSSGVALAQDSAAPAGDAAPAADAADAAGGERQLSPDQQHYVDVVRSLKWTRGPSSVDVGAKSKLVVPDGYMFLGADDTKKFMELNQNPTSSTEYVLAPDDLRWFAVFEYEDTGYVKDDDKIDADAILESIKDGTESGNDERRKRGWPEMHVTGWRVRPAYNEQTKHLEWAIDAQSGGQSSTNLFTKVLGRHGVTTVTLVTDPASLTKDAGEFRKAVDGFTYVDGERYAEFKEGDKVAEYGLAGLIAGGGLAVAAKTGLLKGLWKFLVVGAAGLAALGRKLFGKKTEA
jgi:uncharacterized membrane-anchored protein